MDGCSVGLLVAVTCGVVVGRGMVAVGAVVDVGGNAIVAEGSCVGEKGVGIPPSDTVEVGMLVKICTTRVAILSSSDRVGAARSSRPQPESSTAAVRMVRICFMSKSLLVRNPRWLSAIRSRRKPLSLSSAACLIYRSSLVADHAKKSLAPGDVLIAFDAQGYGAVDHAEDPAPMVAFRDDDLGGVGCSTEDAAYLGHGLNGAEDVNRIKSITEEKNETVARADRLSILLRERDHFIVRAAPADQPFSGGFAESQTELDARHMGDQGLVDILDGLDEMRLPEDEVGLFGFFDLYQGEVHRMPPRLVIPLLYRHCGGGLREIGGSRLLDGRIDVFRVVGGSLEVRGHINEVGLHQEFFTI